MPATAKIKNNNISNRFLEISIDAPKKAKGIDPKRYGKRNFTSRLPDLTWFIEFPKTTMMLQNKAIIGKI